MAMWRLKNCPRCGGDMFIDRDFYGWYEKCLQCAYCCELRTLESLDEKPAINDRKQIMAVKT